PDFNGDGYADLAIGIPNEDITIEGLTFVDAGSVQVIYGTVDGLNASAAGGSLHNDQVWHRGREGLADLINISIGDNFGQALAPADFNNDGYDDLAIGVPGSLIDGNDNVGAVQVMYGSSDGLTVEKSQTWSQDIASIIGSPEAGDRFGETLAAGDFDGDGVADLAIGVPDEGVLAGADQTQAGAINIIYSSGSGLSTLYDDILTQNSVMFFASAEPFDHFGDVLTSGDFNGDGIDDLVVGTPFEDVGVETNAGAVQIYFGGTDSGILDSDGEGTPIYPQEITANTTGVDNTLEAGDRFGFSLAAADFNRDGYDDLAIGSPYETHGAGAGALQFAGAVNIVFGADSGPLSNATTTAVLAPIWHQSSTGIISSAAGNEFFGWSLEAADFNNDGYVDLAIGVPNDEVLGIHVGSVHILYSDKTGPSAAGDTLIYDPDNPAEDDEFGRAVTAVDSNGDSYIDLVVGAPDDDPVGVGVDNAGSVFVFHSDSDGVSQTDNQNWYQDHLGMIGTPETDDQLGSSLP
ncbi:MAG: hypothetical protein GY805_29945, partial [Chloroflexi bacterium]|nr:hypothetical protein [Chloroflexota bacterium]